jgi:hypothetical protein
VYGLPRAVNGWGGLTTLRWLMFLCAVGGIALFVLQGVRRTPAIPVSLSVVLTVVSLVTALALAYRVLINPPGPNSLIDGKAGAYVGLLSTVVLLFGAYRSLRREGVAEGDAPREIETIRLGNAAGP